MIWSAARRLIGGYRPGALVLLYHRVGAPARDPQLMSVRPEKFDEHLRALRKLAVVLPLSELVEAARQERLPPRALAITFDDGYADNLTNAKRILTDHHAPATFFAVSGAVSRQTEFWWDTLDRALLGTSGRATLELDFDGEVVRAELDGAPCDHPGWNVLLDHDPTPRHRSYRQLMPRVKSLLPREREAVLHQLLDQLGLPLGPSTQDRPLTESELRELAAGDLCEVGAHSVAHPQLSKMSADAQFAELRASKSALESLLGRSVQAFAYPYGSRSDYTDESVRLTAKAGFRYACSNFPGRVQKGVDPLQIPRVLVRDIPAPLLVSYLERAFAGRFE